MERASASTIDLDPQYVWHPFTQMASHALIPIVCARGVYLYDVQGNAYIDAISSWWCNLHGHAHPDIVQKISQQASLLEHVLFAGFTHRPAVEIARRLIPILPGKMSKIFFTDNGSTAVEAAIKMAIQYWHNKQKNKKKIVCMKSSYHGDTFGAMSVSGRSAYHRPFWSYLFEVESISAPLHGQEEKALEELKDYVKAGDVACFIYEPLVLGAGGMHIYSADILSELMRLCREYDVLLIADEVMTGFGRTGTLFAGDQVTEQPDITCLSKGLTGGFLPLGAVACRQEIFDAFLGAGLEQAFLHGHTYTANPLSCAAALASLDLTLSDTCTQQRALISSAHADFVQKRKDHPHVTRCQSLGTILAVEYQADKGGYFHSIRDQLYTFFLDNYIVLRPLGNVVYVLPPYCITKQELEKIYDCITHTLEEPLW